MREKERKREREKERERKKNLEVKSVLVEQTFQLVFPEMESDLRTF